MSILICALSGITVSLYLFSFLCVGVCVFRANSCHHTRCSDTAIHLFGSELNNILFFPVSVYVIKFLLKKYTENCRFEFSEKVISFIDTDFGWQQDEAKAEASLGFSGTKAATKTNLEWLILVESGKVERLPPQNVKMNSKTPFETLESPLDTQKSLLEDYRMSKWTQIANLIAQNVKTGVKKTTWELRRFP